MTSAPTRPPIYVTKPHLPPRGALDQYLDQIWQSHRLTNDGPLHDRLEQCLATFMADPPVSDIQVSLVTNGTLALVLALDALRITGEVITTPFTFIATANALYWRRLKPVFVDIDPVTLCIDPAKVQEAITPDTSAILAVHVYGRPCAVDQLATIAATHNLKLIYDAAHAFGVQLNGRSLAAYGDLSTYSFHATKGFHTLEGGVIVSHSAEMKARVNRLRNFGFMHPTGEEIMEPGLNAKMDEFRAAMGLVELECWAANIEQRVRVANRYRMNLANLGRSSLKLFNHPMIAPLDPIPEATETHTYFPVRIAHGFRDMVYQKMAADHAIHCRRYFYPLVSTFPAYRTQPSAAPGNLPNATQIANEILCLPMYPDLADQDVDYICTSLEKCLT